MTTNDLDQAREVADTIAQSPKAYDPGMQATARVIASLPDEWIDANKLRELVEAWGQRFITSDADLLLRDLSALLPAPKPRTLADMPEEEREACQWMQADFDDVITGRSIRVVVTQTSKATADIVLPDGAVNCVYVGKLTPLPDLPRMVWPEEQA